MKKSLFEFVVRMAKEGLAADAIHKRLLNNNLGQVVEWSYSPGDGPIFNKFQDFSPAYGGLAYTLKENVQYLRRYRVDRTYSSLIIDEYERDGRKFIAVWEHAPCFGWACVVYKVI